MRFSPWQWLKGKRVSFLALPLLVMATVTEFVILATGWKYQQTVCLPRGMGVTFFGIGPIGATILAVELLKLPLAAWTASRHGLQKGFMLLVGLPLMCVLTFQLVKDMAVYEMGVAMTPASQLFEQASAEEVKIAHLNNDLAAIEGKRTDRERKLAELAAKKAKGKSDLEESLKHNEATRQDAISLTEYQKKELSEVEVRQAAIIKQFDADAAQLTKAIADLRAQRETEVGRATQWNAEEARIENAYKAKMATYANEKAAYEKAKAEYDGANFLRRQLMREPVSPGVPPVREANTVLKPAEIAEFDAQIKAKEAELAAVNTKRRDRVAQVDTDARRLREGFDLRSGTRREEADRKREELLAAHAALSATLAVEEKQINQEFQAVAQKVDGIRGEIEACHKKVEGLYEAREAAIKNTQVHRIATTVEIVRGLVMGERPVSITATAKERGDLYTDQISMVRIWVYPVLAFLVAFLPTLMVEIGFSTIFEPERQRPPHRLGFLGRRLHWLYTRAGRLKILRAERLASEATAKIAARDQSLANKEAELQAAREAIGKTVAMHEQELKQKEGEWVAKYADLAESLNRAVIEKDALRDLQKAEIERQIQMRQNAWSDRLTQLRRELDDQRAASEAERTAMMQEHQGKLLEVAEDSKAQVIQARRQLADAELAAAEKAAKLTHDLKEASNARDAAESQLARQADSFSFQLSQAREDAAREIEKAVRQEKQRLERQQMEFGKTLRQRDAAFERQLKQREEELSLAFEARVVEERTKVEQEAFRHEAELASQFEVRAAEADARWRQEVQRREEAAQTRFKQQEKQLQAQTEVRLSEAKTEAEQELRRLKLEFERQHDAQSREAEARLREEMQQKDLAFQARLKQREQELTNKAAAREIELQNTWAAASRVREEEWERQTGLRVRAAEACLTQEAQQKEELFQSKLRQRDEQWQVKLDALRAELQAQTEQEFRRRDAESAAARGRALHELEVRLRQEMQQKDEEAQAAARQREQDLAAKLAAQTEAHQAAQAQWELTSEEKLRATAEHFQALLDRTEKERDEARYSAHEGVGQVQELEKKLIEASSLLTSWKNGNGNGRGAGGKKRLVGTWAGLNTL